MDLRDLLRAFQVQAPSSFSDAQIKGQSDFAQLKKMGNESFAKKQYATAIKCYKRAVEFTKNDEDIGTVSNNRALCHQLLGDWEEALAQSQVALDKRPTWFKAHLRHAGALIALERPDEAETIVDNKEIFPEETEDLLGLREQIAEARIAWKSVEDNVRIKILHNGVSEGSANDNGDGSGDSSDGEYPLEDLDRVAVHYRVLDTKTRKLLESTKFVYSMPGMPPQGESDHVEPRRYYLAEYELPEVLEMAIVQLKDGGECKVQISGPCSFYPEGPSQALEFQVFLLAHEKARKANKVRNFDDILSESRRASAYLKSALTAKEKLDTFDRSKAAADQQKEEALEVAWACKSGASCAIRRFRRALEFYEHMNAGASSQNDSANPFEVNREAEHAAILSGLGRALVLQEHTFTVEKGDSAQGDFGRDLIKFLEAKGHVKCSAMKNLEKNANEEVKAAEKPEYKEALERIDASVFVTLKMYKLETHAAAVEFLQTNASNEEIQKFLVQPLVESYLAKAECLNSMERAGEAQDVIENGFQLDAKNEQLRSERARLNIKAAKQQFADVATQVADMKIVMDKMIAVLNTPENTAAVEKFIAANPSLITPSYDRATDFKMVTLDGSGPTKLSEEVLKKAQHAPKSLETLESTKNIVDSDLLAQEAKDALIWLTANMEQLGAWCDDDLIEWDALMRIKIGKPVGQIQKAAWADPVIKKLAFKLIRQFREMAERSRPLWS